jgi:hypothetical protein
MSEHIDAVRAVVNAARALVHGVRVGNDPIPLDDVLCDAVDALEELLSAPVPDKRDTWMRVLVHDEVLMKSGQWVKVAERWTRRNCIEVCVLLPGTLPTDEPQRKTYPVQPDGKVTRRPSPDAYAVELLTEALGGYVIASREEGKW